MSEEIENTAVEPAPVEEVTATTETEEVTEPVEVETEPEKLLTQEEFDKALSKRLARERRKIEREIAAKQPIATEETGDLSTDDINIRVQKGVEAELARREQRTVAEKFEDRVDEFIDEHPDYDEKVTNNTSLPISREMADVIKFSDVGPQLAYHLADNPKEAERISKLSPLLQAKELGRLEVSITATPEVKQSNAPAPITPIKPKSGGDQDPAKMSPAEYRKYSREQRRSI